PAQAGASGLYAGDSGLALPPRRSKVGLIAIIVAAVVVIGAVIAIVAVSKGKDKDKVAAGSIDAATAVAPAVDAATGVAPAVDAAGGAAVELDAGAVPLATDAAVGTAIDAGAVTPPNTVVVLVHSSTRTAEVYDNGQKLGRVPQTIIVAAGEEHEVVLKAAGYKDEVLQVDGREPRIDVTMTRVAGTGPGTGHGSGHGSGSGSGSSHGPPPPDCDNNPTDPRCGL
ncbi:MAG TPA: PEGA domain-containing protein, partial [Kofleriaceae bacterium]|nr:PEGA domain-containing protein [Kofleriaceae bacterium]